MKRTSVASFCSKYTWVNPKSLPSAYDVKAYVLLIAILPSNEDVKPIGPLAVFQKSRLMSAPGFSSIHHPYITTHIH